MNAPKIPHLDVSIVDKAISLWRAGELVAMPTETVYGLAADATNGEAVARIYATKSRPQFNPLIIHVADIATAKRYVEWNAMADALASAFWPGPMTLVLRKRPEARGQRAVSELVSAGGDTLAVRIPAHAIAQQLLAAFGGPIAAPSANRSGRVSPTTAQHVRDEFGDSVKLIIDGGPCAVGLESTVVDVTGDAPVVLRPGAITSKHIQSVIPSNDGIPLATSQSGTPGQARGDSTVSLKSPGQLASHYAPSIPVRLNATSVAAGEALLAFGPAQPAGAIQTLNLSPSGNLIEAAANLFAHLRALDIPAHRAIAVMPIPDDVIGAAINDRLMRASARD
ncbi:MAG: L-threonylcarbamoyladenylate synthase [Rickettsiales bacterium]